MTKMAEPPIVDAVTIEMTRLGLQPGLGRRRT